MIGLHLQNCRRTYGGSCPEMSARENEDLNRTSRITSDTGCLVPRDREEHALPSHSA